MGFEGSKVVWLYVMLLSVSLVTVAACVQVYDSRPVDKSPVTSPAFGEILNQPTETTVPQGIKTVESNPVRPSPSTVIRTTTPPIVPTRTPVSQAVSQDLLDPIQFESPGDGSILNSPIDLRIEFPGMEPGKIIRIELYDSQNKLLYREVVRKDPLLTTENKLHRRLDFEINGESDVGWLIVHVEDIPGQPLAINSVQVDLISDGDPKIARSEPQKRRIEITTPVGGETVSGGKLLVSGVTRVDSLEPLKVQLVKLDGTLISQRLASVVENPSGIENQFSSELTYNISEKTETRLIVYLDQGPYAHITHLASIPLTMMP